PCRAPAPFQQASAAGSRPPWHTPRANTDQFPPGDRSPAWKYAENSTACRQRERALPRSKARRKAAPRHRRRVPARVADRQRVESSAVLEDDGLGLGKLTQRFDALFPAVTAFLYAAERQFDPAARAVTVNEHLAAAHFLRYPHLPCAIAGPDAGYQAVVGRIGELDRVGFIFERDHRQHRSKHLFAGQLVCARHRPEQNRGHVETPCRHAIGNLCLREHRHTVIPCLLDEALYPLFLVGGNQRAAIQIHGMAAYTQLSKARGDLRDETIVDRLLHQHAAARGAGL